MFKINDEIMKSTRAYFDFNDTTLRLPNGKQATKFSPRIWVEGINIKNEKRSIMVETIISEEELKKLKLNKEIKLKLFKFGKNNNINECITDIILFTDNNFNTAIWLNQHYKNEISIKRISENTFNIKTNIKKVQLFYDVEIELE